MNAVLGNGRVSSGLPTIQGLSHGGPNRNI